MATLREIVYNVTNVMRGGIQSDDEPISERQVAYLIKNMRAALTKKYQQTNPSYLGSFNNLVQDLGCLETVCVDRSECCNIQTDCHIMRTKETIPNSIGEPFYVGLVDRSRAFEVTSYPQARWSRYSKYTSRTPRAYFFGNYIYVTSEEVLDFIHAQMILDNPEEINKFRTCETCKPFNWDSEYPIDNWMVNEIERQVQNVELRMLALSQMDTKNNMAHEGTQAPITA